MKKNILWLVTVLLVIGGMIFYTNKKEPVRMATTTVNTDTAPDLELNKEQEATASTDEKPATERVKEKVKEIIEGALSFFHQNKKIVAIGDSLTQGVGDESDNGGYVGILDHTFEANDADITIENFGKRGNRTDQLLDRLEDEEISSAIKKADFVFITIGANDVMKVVKNNFTNLNLEPFQEEKTKYAERLTAIFHKINQLNPNTQIYLLGFYNPFDGYFGDIEQLDIILDEWNQASEAVTEQFDNVDYIPTDDLFYQSSENLLADDHFHPNTSGYKRMAERVLEYLNEFEENTKRSQENVE